MRWLRELARLILCLIPWALAVYGLMWIVNAHAPADGTMVIDIPLSGRSPWFEAFLPGQRASSPGEQEGGWIGQRITDEPVYARLRVPGAYQTADIEMEVRPHEQPLLELGIERGMEPAVSYEMLPVWSRELQQSSFVTTTVDGVIWWVDPRLGAQAARSADEGRAAWHASGTIALPTMDRGPVESVHIDASLRGQHDWWFVPVNGQLRFAVTMQDMNRSRVTANATWRLMRDQELIWSDSVNFGGQDDTKPSPIVERSWVFRDLAPGVYRLSLLADDSIFVRSWDIQAKRWVLGPRVYFADEVGYVSSTRSRQVWTNSTHLEVKTLHKEGLQTLQLGSASATLFATHQTYALARAPGEWRGPVQFTAPMGNVWLVGNAYISWTREALFFPTVQRLTDATRLRDEGIYAVATTYRAPEPIGKGWYRIRAKFALDPALDRAKIVLAAPGIARRNQRVDIRRIHVTYQRSPRREGWWEALRQELMRAWRRW